MTVTITGLQEWLNVQCDSILPIIVFLTTEKKQNETNTHNSFKFNNKQLFVLYVYFHMAQVNSENVYVFTELALTN